MDFLRNSNVGTAVGYLSIIITGSLFLLAGSAKILRPRPFVNALKLYSLLPPTFVPLAAVSLPVVEIVLGLAMFRSGHSRILASLCATLLLGFAAAMSVNLLRGRGNVPCGCGFLGKGTISWLLVFPKRHTRGNSIWGHTWRR